MTQPISARLIPRYKVLKNELQKALKHTRAKKIPKRLELIRPVINKTELDNIQPDDQRHFQKVAIPDGYESNAFSYHPRLHKFIKILMKGGDSYRARDLVEKALYRLKLRQVEKYNKAEDPNEKEKIETRPLKIFLTALDNCKPILKIVKISKGGITYQVPTPMSEKEREFRATKLLISSCQERFVDARDKKLSLNFFERFSHELLDAFNNQGKSIRKKIDIHKLAEANKAYAHYKWTSR